MNATGRVAGGLPAGGEKKLIYESQRTRVFRSCPTAGAACVIFKEPRGYSATRRVRRERALLGRLAAVPGVVRLADQEPPAGMIALEDAGPTTLGDTLTDGHWPVARLLEFACEFATVLAGVHDARVIHRDLNPSNIVWKQKTGQLTLLDFDLATVAAEDLPTFAHPSTIAGTLAYLAPEQTGRTGWPVDQRADLYGFGAILYELATGGPPFGFADPLRLVHDHLAKVPTAPIARNPDLPIALSQVILRLLEKEPDLRYQSAEGLAYDLLAIRNEPDAPITLGGRDFPPRLVAPSRLIGRESEVEILTEAVRRSASGPAQCLLITGAPGVGKSALLDQLRSIVAEREGWFASGKFDQFRQDLETNGARQAMSGLCQLMLAEPEETLEILRTRLLEILGPNSGIVCSYLPDLAPLLGFPQPPEVSDPLVARVRMQQSGLAVLRTVASSRRPVVIALDDLQWAPSPPLEFVDAILTDPHLSGVLVVGAYRESEIAADHPLTAMLSRWDEIGVSPQRLILTNLPKSAIDSMLSEMLRLPEDQASPLAATVTAKTAGNPYDTVELINALRREEALVPTGNGWRLRPGRVLGLPNRVGALELLRERMEALPPRTASLLEIMACLGGEVDISVLADATGHRAADVESDLIAALEEGLIVASDRDDSFRFRHDRIQRAAFDRLAPQQLVGLRLELGRRLAAQPNRKILAAEQYISIVDAVHSRSERRTLIALFHNAATDAQRISNGPRAERFLSAAADLLASTGQANQTVLDLAIDRHSALYTMGRLAEADEVYQQITKLTSDPLRVAAAAPAQISSLTGRNQPTDAVRIGIDLIHALGQPVPESPEELASEIERGMTAVFEWAATGDELDDLRRVDCDDQRVLAIARIIDRVLPPAFMSGYPGTPWLILVAARIWTKHGPARDLVGALSYIAMFTIGLRDDYRTGAMIVRRVLAVSEARGYEPETSHVRCNYAVSCAPWFEPLEEVVELAHQAYEGLVRGGENHFATHAYYCSLPNLLGCARTIDEVAVEADAALAFATRTGNDDAAVFYLFFRQLARTMRGETLATGSFQDAAFDEDRHLAMMAGNGSITGVAHALLGINAAIFGDADGVIRHATALDTLIPFLLGTYHSAFGHLVLAIAATHQIRAAGANESERARWLARFDTLLAWFAARAADAPGTFGHLVPWLRAERAVAVGDFRSAMVGFDSALRAAAQRGRRWQQGLIAERAAQFSLENGLLLSGETLLREARLRYDQWGATAKVLELERRHPELTSAMIGVVPDSFREAGAVRPASAISAEEIDLIGVLNASQALSSETNLDRLRLRVKSILKAMTGATSVQVAVWNEDSGGWLISIEDEMIPLGEAAARRMIPISVFHYVERTAQPLVAADATRDSRFAKDPYFAGMKRCSLLAVPILSRGAIRALVVLENQLSRNAFVGDRLDSVMLIAGQLAVSVDNALLYASLERKVAERTEALAIANQRLETLSVTDALTGLANRRRLADVLDLEWKRALRPGTSLGLAMIDIDYFKAYNDCYGHPAGDQCLRRVAAALNETVRATDLAARYGGEEFAVVMPGVNLVLAKRISDRIREAVVALHQPHERSPLGIVTVSVGVAATVPSTVGVPDQLVDLADHRLYQAKNHGRNRVVFS